MFESLKKTKMHLKMNSQKTYATNWIILLASIKINGRFDLIFFFSAVWFLAKKLRLGKSWNLIKKYVILFEKSNSIWIQANAID